MKKVVDFEFISFEDLREEDLQYEFDEFSNEEDVLEEHYIILSVAKILEELYQL